MVDKKVKQANTRNRRYYKTFNGKLMMTYNNMDRRVRGILKQKAHLYKGKEILDRQEFYEWSSTNENYIRLFQEWVASGCDSKLSPSIDRIDSSLGYAIDNMQWITHSENSTKGANSRYNNN